MVRTRRRDEKEKKDKETKLVLGASKESHVTESAAWHTLF